MIRKQIKTAAILKPPDAENLFEVSKGLFLFDEFNDMP